MLRNPHIEGWGYELIVLAFGRSQLVEDEVQFPAEVQFPDPGTEYFRLQFDPRFQRGRTLDFSAGLTALWRQLVLHRVSGQLYKVTSAPPACVGTRQRTILPLLPPGILMALR